MDTLIQSPSSELRTVTTVHDITLNSVSLSMLCRILCLIGHAALLDPQYTLVTPEKSTPRLELCFTTYDLGLCLKALARVVCKTKPLLLLHLKILGRLPLRDINCLYDRTTSGAHFSHDTVSPRILGLYPHSTWTKWLRSRDPGASALGSQRLAGSSPRPSLAVAGPACWLLSNA